MVDENLLTRKKTVADIWIEVQAEQKRFNTVLRYMTLVVVLALTAAGIAAFMSFSEFKNLRHSYQEQIAYSVAKSAVQNGQAQDDRHQMRIELLSLKDENSQNRVFARLPRETDRALVTVRERDEQTIEDLTRQAHAFAKLSAVGDLRLNPSTSYLIESLLELNFNSPENPVFTPEEVQFMRVALIDWQQPMLDETRQAWTTLLVSSNDPDLRGHASAGLAHFFLRAATASSQRLGWRSGCRETVEMVTQAKALNVESIALNLAAGACLRKNGDFEEAYGMFVDGLTLLANDTTFDVIPDGDLLNKSLLKFRIDASHGAGTTLIPFAINLAENGSSEEGKLESIALTAARLPDEFSELKDQIERSRTVLEVSENFLNSAIKLRQKRNEGEIGEFASKENLGYVYLAQGKWDKALKLAREIDNRMARHWNLIVYAIALQELGNADTEEFRSVVKKIELMRQSGFDSAEIRRLLSNKHRNSIRLFLGDQID